MFAGWSSVCHAARIVAKGRGWCPFSVHFRYLFLVRRLCPNCALRLDVDANPTRNRSPFWAPGWGARFGQLGITYTNCVSHLPAFRWKVAFKCCTGAGAKTLGHPLVQEGGTFPIPAVGSFLEVIILGLLDPKSAGTIIFPSFRSRACSHNSAALARNRLFLEWRPRCVPTGVPALFVHCCFGTSAVCGTRLAKMSVSGSTLAIEPPGQDRCSSHRHGRLLMACSWAAYFFKGVSVLIGLSSSRLRL